MRLLLIDNFDSFTYTLVDYLKQAGADCVVYRNDVLLDTIRSEDYDAVVLSPGPGTPEKAGNLMEVIDYYHTRRPMLGVCLGHQAIGQYFGARLTKSMRPMHGKVSTIHVDTSDVLFRELPGQVRVTRYHSLALTEMPPELTITAWCQTQETTDIMAIRHQRWPIFGVQFHPEAVLTECGLAMLRNFLQSTKHDSTL